MKRISSVSHAVASLQQFIRGVSGAPNKRSTLLCCAAFTVATALSGCAWVGPEIVRTGMRVPSSGITSCPVAVIPKGAAPRSLRGAFCAKPTS